MKQLIVVAFAAAGLIVSLIADRQKTFRALRVAAKRFLAMLPAFLTMLASVGLVLALIPEERIVAFLGADNLFLSTIAGALAGSIALMPGFIAFPLAGILLSKGVAYTVLSAFTTTLMMVGVLTFPIERRYFGTTVAIIRNVISLAVAIAIAIATGWYFGEIG